MSVLFQLPQIPTECPAWNGCTWDKTGTAHSGDCGGYDGNSPNREGCSWIGLKEWSNFPDVSSPVSIAVIKHHEPKQVGDQRACFRSQLSGHILSLRDGQGKDSKQGLRSKS